MELPAATGSFWNYSRYAINRVPTCGEIHLNQIEIWVYHFSNNNK